jgi:hypothetical protein
MVADPPVHRSIYPGINSTPHIDYIIDRCSDWIRRPRGWVQIDCAHRRGAAAVPQLAPVNGSSCSNCYDSGQSIQHGAYCRKCKHHTRLSLVKLCEHLGGRVAKHPSIAIARDRDRGLSSGVALMEPSRTPRQLRQLQFHCGKPPPAAAPRTQMITIRRL